MAPGNVVCSGSMSNKLCLSIAMSPDPSASLHLSFSINTLYFKTSFLTWPQRYYIIPPTTSHKLQASNKPNQNQEKGTYLPPLHRRTVKEFAPFKNPVAYVPKCAQIRKVQLDDFHKVNTSMESATRLENTPHQPPHPPLPPDQKLSLGPSYLYLHPRTTTVLTSKITTSQPASELQSNEIILCVFLHVQLLGVKVYGVHPYFGVWLPLVLVAVRYSLV